MSQKSELSPPSDVCLLLRVHAEQYWLSREVIPVLRQLETHDSLPEEQVDAAMAYLEVIWIQAQRRAHETDTTHAALKANSSEQSPLPAKACRYYNAVRHLREVVHKRVSLVLHAPAPEPAQATVKL